jgi:phosphoglycerate dehydrogenase-like enzyme
MQVVVLDDYQDAARESGPWERLGETTSVDFVHTHLVGDELVQRLAGAEVVVAMRERTTFDAGLLRACPAMRLLVTTGMYNAAIDLETAHAMGITVCGTGWGQPGPTAELTWSLVTALARGLLAETAAMRGGGWQVGVGEALAGKTFGVIGLGNLGSRVARVAQAFEMRVLAWSENLEAETARALDVEPVSKTELLTSSDVVSVHLVLSERTAGLIGADELRLMRSSAYLINTSRAPIVDTKALLDSLYAGEIAGAGIDVYDEEPLPRDHPLRAAPNTVLTPHIGYVTVETYSSWFEEAVADIEAWLAGSPTRVLTLGV